MSAIPASRYRWWILGVFVLSTSVNYLDRQTLAVLAPALQKELGLSDTMYGLLVFAFSVPYAIVAPFAGLFIDYFGLTRAISLALALWSCAGIATGFTRGVVSLFVCRIVLGIAEAAGIPAAGKAIVTLVKPGERAIGHATNQAAVSLGSMLAPVLATYVALHWGGWRNAFIVTGVLGLLWIPLWRTVGNIPATAPVSAAFAPHRDSRLWAIAGATALHAIPYSLWFGWTTKYLYTVFQLDLAGANLYAWIPPGAALLGGFLCGWASLRIAQLGSDVVTARLRVCLVAAVAALATGVVPLASSPAWAVAAISIGLGAVAGFSVNLYALPLDLFGESRAAFAISILVATNGAATAFISPAIGWMRDHHGYVPVTTVAAVTTLLGYLLLRGMKVQR
ncbi:MAG TPA: MFS transporter [Candidatus Solibacter sp.]|nr:MFS transporter [Candidatus Solibacter sp.]